jgi:DUF2892 family protein
MNNKRRMHDAIVGLFGDGGGRAGTLCEPHWYLLPAVIGVTLMQRGVTGFCPVYFAFDRLLPSEGQVDTASCCTK